MRNGWSKRLWKTNRQSAETTVTRIQNENWINWKRMLCTHQTYLLLLLIQFTFDCSRASGTENIQNFHIGWTVNTRRVGRSFGKRAFYSMCRNEKRKKKRHREDQKEKERRKKHSPVTLSQIHTTMKWKKQRQHQQSHQQNIHRGEKKRLHFRLSTLSTPIAHTAERISPLVLFRFRNIFFSSLSIQILTLRCVCAVPHTDTVESMLCRFSQKKKIRSAEHARRLSTAQLCVCKCEFWIELCFWWSHSTYTHRNLVLAWYRFVLLFSLLYIIRSKLIFGLEEYHRPRFQFGRNWKLKIISKTTLNHSLTYTLTGNTHSRARTSPSSEIQPTRKMHTRIKQRRAVECK